jgi:hypothetical protein
MPLRPQDTKQRPASNSPPKIKRRIVPPIVDMPDLQSDIVNAAQLSEPSPKADCQKRVVKMPPSAGGSTK